MRGITRKVGLAFSSCLFTAIVCGLTGGVSAPAHESEPAGQTKLEATRALLVSRYADVMKHMGGAEAADLQMRIDDDLAAYLSGSVPEGFTKSDWIIRLDGLADLDSSLVAQVAAGKPEPLASVHGLVERTFVSHLDGTLQPLALYVPPALGKDPTLVILLHGNPQTEAEILSGPYFRTLADMTGTIVGAPLARGVPGYPPPANVDIYDAADYLRAAYHVGPHRTYLVGYSNGGFAVFKVGPIHPDVWNAIMCIAGAVVDSEAASVRSGFATKRVYVVNGAKDENIPPQLGEQTAHWLAGVGIQTGLYQAPAGTHYISTLMPTLKVAWRDMMAGSIGPVAGQAAGYQTPQP